MDCLCKFFQLFWAKSGRITHYICGELRDKICKRLKAGGMSVNVVAVNPTICDEPVCQGVQQDKIGFRPDGVMLGRGHRCLRLSRIDHDDFGPVLILAYALPHDRVCDTKIRTNKDKHIGAVVALAMHWRVLPSPCRIPMPNFARAPRNASSSVQIWPVPSHAIASLPYFPWMALKRSVKFCSAVCQSTGSR